MFGRLGSGTDLTGLLQTIRGELLPALEPLLQQMNKGDLLGKIGDLLGKVATFASLIDVPTVGVFVGLLGQIVGAFLWIAQNVPGVRELLTAVGLVIVFWGPAAAIIGGIISAWTALRTAILGVRTVMFLLALTAPGFWAAITGPIGIAILVVAALVAAFIWAYNNVAWFRDGVDAVVGAVKQFFIGLWEKVVEVAAGIGQAWTDGVKWITDAWAAVGAFFTDLWQNHLVPFFEGVWYWIKFIGAIIFTILVAPFVLAFNLLKEPVLEWWNGIIIPMVDGIVWLWGKLVEGTQWLAGKWDEFWAFIGQVIRTWYDTQIVPVLGFVKAKWDEFLGWLDWLKAMWDASWVLIGQKLQEFYDTYVAPIIAFVVAKWQWLLDKLDFLKGVWLLAWSLIGFAFQKFYNDYIDPVVGFVSAAWDRLIEKLSWVKTTFDTIISGIGTAWEGLKSLMAVPINWVIKNVINDAFVATWNWIADKVGIGKATPVAEITGFATGGPIHGRGTGTSDSIIARVSNDEHVWTAAEVAAAGGHRKVKQMREVALRGGRSAVESFLAFGGESLSQFAQGGAISAAAGSAVTRGQQWAQSQAGKPYVWGAGGPSGYDCSGFQGAIWGLLTTGRPNFGHPFSTASFAGGRGAFGFVPGYSSAYTIGVSPPGGRTGGTGHMAGNIGGMNVESRGGDGVVVGPRAAGPENSMFNYKFSLPEAGGIFVSGGAGGGGGGGVAAFTWEIAKAALDALLAPVFAMLPNPPPEIMGIPRKFAETGRDHLYKFAQDKLSSLFGSGAGGVAMGASAGDVGGIVKIICDVARGRFGALAKQASVIGVATGIVESHLQNLAGGDRDSVGVFQQRPSQGWGTVAECMNVARAAGMFFSRFPGGWASMEPGGVAQGVQRSAYPLKYAQHMGEAAGYVNQFGGFDQGGMLPPGWNLAYNGTGAPERVLTEAQWGALAPSAAGGSRDDHLLAAIGELATAVAERPPALSVSGRETEQAVYSALREYDREKAQRGRYQYG